MSSCFMWTVSDVIGLAVASLAGLFLLVLFGLIRFQDWQAKRRERVSK